MPSTLMKTAEEAAVLTSLVAAVGWVGKKALKETFTGDPSSSVMNYVKMTAAVAGSIALRDYLIKEKYLPNSI